jgi:TIR domain-containing protein
MARDVFISYSHADRECAFELVACLEGRGIDCWIAPRDIAPSADWAAEIMDALSAARVMVLVFSANSNQSPQVRREVERAVHKQLVILPFRIEDVAPSKSLELFLSAQHWLDAFPPPREPYYARLCAQLEARRSATPDVKPPPTISVNLRAAFDAAELQHIERQLAGYIGPLARHLVKAAAAPATGMEDLLARLAAEIDTEAERGEFVRRCRRRPGGA